MRRGRVLLFALAALAAPAALRAQAIPAGPGGQLSSLVGVPFDVPFVIDLAARTEKLGSFAARITWDPAVLRFDAALPGNFGSATVNQDSLAQGILRLAGANPAGVGGAVTVTSARFTPIASATTTIGMTVSEAFAAITFADLLPSVTASGGTFCPARGRYGDIDVDGAANSRDALIALSNAVGLDVSAFDITLGDVDASGATNARDALIILSSAVGLDVSAFLVYRMALGACTSPTPVTLAISPAVTGDLVPGDVVRFEARATDASGALQTVPDAVWISSNPVAVAVLSTGQAIVRDTGTAVITAVRDGRDTARVTVRVVPRRTAWYVSATAINAESRIGTPALPLASLSEASTRNLGAGDTVVVQPGRYGEGGSFARRVVIIGQSAGGVDAVLAASGAGVGLQLDGSGVSEIHNLAVEGFDVGISTGNADTVVLDSVRILARAAGSTCFQAAIETGDLWALIVRHSTLVGDGRNGCATGIGLYGNVRLVVVEDTRITDFGNGDTGIYGFNVDSLVVRRSIISDNGSQGIYVYAYPYYTGGRVPPATSVALVVEDSRLERNNYEPIYAYDLRSAVIAHTVIDTRTYFQDALNLYGIDSAYVRLVGDSILLDTDCCNDWFDGYGFDSVLVDSTRVVGAYYGDLDGVDYVRVRNSSFTESTGGTMLYVYSNRLPEATIVVDSVTATGSSSCSQCMEFIYASSARVTVNRLRLDNFDYGIYSGDSNVTVTNSVFTNGYSGIYAYSYATPRPRLEVRQVTMTGVYYGIESYNMVTVVDSVNLTGTAGEYEGVYTYGGGADTVRFSAVTGYDYGIDLEDSVGYAANNTMLRPTYDAFYFYGNGTAADSAVMVNNTVTCDAYGAENAGGVEAHYSNVRFEGNTVTGCNWGLYISSGSASQGVKVRGNTISIPSVADYSGIWIYGPYRSEVVGNVVTGGAPYADGNIYLYGYSYAHAPFARVDSNTVQQAQVWGIRVEYVDSVEVRGNLVEDVSTPCCFTNPGGIALYGATRYQARIAGNTLRRAHGAAIAINQFDTATAFVDSNAVSLADTVGVRLFDGSVQMRGNNIRNNLRDGVRFESTFFDNVEMHGNAFKGNGRYAVANYGDASVNSDGNWWGVDGQPPRQSGDTAIAGVDSVLYFYDNAPLAAEPSGLPPLVPPAPIVAARAGASAVPAAPSGRVAVGPVGVTAAGHRTRAERLAEREARLRAEVLRTPAAAAATAEAGGGRLRRPARPADQVQAARAIERAGAQVRAEVERATDRAARDSVRVERRERRAAPRRNEQ